MQTKRPSPTLALSAVFSLLVGACSVGAPTPGSIAAVCDRIPADMGGCSSARPVFAGTTCKELAAEWGVAVDRQVVAVIKGPAEVAGKMRSVLVGDALTLSSVAVGLRLNDLGLLPSCDVPEFLPIAEAQFTPELRAGIGNVLFDAEPVATESDWRARLARAIGIIDEGE